MTLHFHIEYNTNFGEEVSLNIIEGHEVKSYRMTTINGTDWYCDLAQSKATTLTYYYKVSGGSNGDRYEWQMVRHLLDMTSTTATEYTIYDRWNSMPDDSYLYSSAFTDCINHQEPQQMKATSFAQTVRITVRAPQLRNGERLAVIGSAPSLGGWNPEKSLPMTLHNYGEWAIDIDAAPLHNGPVELKFVITDASGSIQLWECGYNRSISLPTMSKGQVVVYHLDQAFFEIYNHKLAGTLVPVFSLRSKSSAGVGDFGEISVLDFVPGDLSHSGKSNFSP